MDRHRVSLGLLFLRACGGALMLQGRAATWAAMIQPNRALLSHPFGPGGELGWILTLLSEGLCTLLVMLGVFTRLAAVPPLVSLLVVGLAMPVGTAWSLRAPWLQLALPFFVLTFTGAGEYSFDARVASWGRPR